jgi:hypothetical protein
VLNLHYLRDARPLRDALATRAGGVVEAGEVRQERIGGVQHHLPVQAAAGSDRLPGRRLRRRENDDLAPLRAPHVAGADDRDTHASRLLSPL